MKAGLKIAIYSGVVPAPTFIERLIQGLAAKGTEVYIFGLQHHKVKSIPGVFYYTYKKGKLHKLLQYLKYSLLLTLFKPKAKKELNAILGRSTTNLRLLKMKSYPVLYHQPDIFHLQWAKSLADWIWVQEFGIKLVLSLRGTHITISPIADDDLAKLYRMNFSKVDAFHAVSHATGVIAQTYGAPAQKVITIYSGLPLNTLPFNLKKEIAAPLKILSIGRSHWTKDYRTALDAMAMLKKENIEFNYTIIGVAQDESLIFQRDQLDLLKEVIFLEELPFETVKQEIQNADVLLLPSIEEGIANVILEAMALGTLVVSTDCGGMNEVIKDKQNGFLIPIRNPSDITLSLHQVAELSIEDYQNMTNTARFTIEQQHSDDKMISEMQLLYENAINDRLCE